METGVRAWQVFLIGVAVLVGAGHLGEVAQGEVVLTYGGTFDLPIPADPEATQGWMDDAIITVTDHFVIGDVDVGINLRHTGVFDLQLSLTSPSGTTVILNLYDPFFGYFDGDNYQSTMFDDEALLSITEGQAPFAGSYRPLEALSAFDGEDAYGSWHLGIYDAWPMDTGTLTSFRLVLTTPEPATGVLLLLGVGLWRRRRVGRASSGDGRRQR
jgi:hypothetical protein